MKINKYASTNKYRKVEREYKELIDDLEDIRNKKYFETPSYNVILSDKEMYKQCEQVYNVIKNKDCLVRSPYIVDVPSEKLDKLVMGLMAICLQLARFEDKGLFPVYVDSDGAFFNLDLYNLMIDDIIEELKRRGELE